MSVENVDVVVVGAGLAGLTAARRLVAGGASVAVLEARERVGGRTFSREIGGGTFDLGGQWIGPQQRRLHALIVELGLKTFPTYDTGARVLCVAGRRSTYTGEIPSLSALRLAEMQFGMTMLDRATDRVTSYRPWAMPESAELDATTVAAWRAKFLRSRETRAVMDLAVRSVFGAEPSELSLLYFLAYLKAGGGLMKLVGVRGAAQQDRFVDGAQSVSSRIAADLGERVHLGAAVRAIRQDADGVSVETDRGSWRARYAVVAIPPALAGRIWYEPALPYHRDALLQRFPMGATIKCHVLYERPFWREQGYSGEAVSNEGLVAATFDNTTHDGAQPALVGFIVGRPAREWSARGADERRKAVLAALSRMFGREAERAVAYEDQDWCRERWTGGCPVAFLGTGALSNHGHVLREPFGRVHWAGTETATEWTGYLEGAIDSGERAATETGARL